MNVVAVRGEGEWQVMLRRQLPGRGRRLRGEVTVQELGPEAPDDRGKLSWLVRRQAVQAGLGNDGVSQLLARRSQRENPQLDSASPQLRQLAGDEALGEFREDVEHVGDPAG